MGRNRGPLKERESGGLGMQTQTPDSFPSCVGESGESLGAHTWVPRSVGSKFRLAPIPRSHEVGGSLLQSVHVPTV